MSTRWRVAAVALIVAISGIEFFGTLPEPDPASVLLRPSDINLLGTDGIGRSVLIVLVHALSATLADCVLVAILASTIAFLFVVTSVRWLNRWPDRLVVQSADAIRSFPSILLAMVFASLYVPIVMVLVVVVWVPIWRSARAECSAYLGRPFVLRARLSGLGFMRILVALIGPNAWPVVRPAALMAMAETLIGLASLEFLGFGRGVGEPGLGTLAAQVLYLGPAAWWVWFPATLLVSSLIATVAWWAHTKSALGQR